MKDGGEIRQVVGLCFRCLQPADVRWPMQAERRIGRLLDGFGPGRLKYAAVVGCRGALPISRKTD